MMKCCIATSHINKLFCCIANIQFPQILCRSFSKEFDLGLNVSQREMMLEISHDLTTWIKRCGQFTKITRNTTGQMDHFGIISKTILLWSSVQHFVVWNFQEFGHQKKFRSLFSHSRNGPRMFFRSTGLSKLQETLLVTEIFPAFRCHAYRTDFGSFYFDKKARCQTYRTLSSL